MRWAEAALGMLFLGFFARSGWADDSAPSTWGTGKPPADVIRAHAEAQPANGTCTCDCGSDGEATFDAQVESFAGRVARSRAMEAARERAAFDESAERSEKALKLKAWLDERDSAAFDQRVTEQEKLIELTQQLEAAHEREELREFEDGVERALKIRAFLSDLVDRAKKARGMMHPPLANEPKEWSAPK